MTELKPSRPFEERFLDGYERSQLSQEVQKVKPCRFRAAAQVRNLGSGRFPCPWRARRPDENDQNAETQPTRTAADPAPAPESSSLINEASPPTFGNRRTSRDR